MSATQAFRYCPQCGTPLQSGERGGKSRTFCPAPACGFVHWNNPTPVVSAIVEQDGHIVMVRSIGWPEGWYGLVAGFLEQDEHPEAAVLREVKEETGLDGIVTQFIGHYPFPMRNQIIMVYHVLAQPGEVVIDPTELEGYRLTPIAEAQPWDRGTGIALRDWLRTKGFERELISLSKRASS